MTTSPPPYGGHDDEGGQDDNRHGDRPQGYEQQGHPEQQEYVQQQGYGQQAYGQPGYGPSGYPAAPGYSGGPAPQEVDNSFGIIALVTGLLGLLVFPPVAVAGIIYGRKSTAAAAAGRATNGSMGTAGFVLGIIGTVLLVIYVVLIILFVVIIFGTTTSMN